MDGMKNHITTVSLNRSTGTEPGLLLHVMNHYTTTTPPPPHYQGYTIPTFYNNM